MGRSFCEHDLLGRVKDMADFERRMASTTRTMGDSDSGLLFFVPLVRRMFPQAKWILVERPIEDVVASLSAVCSRNKNWAEAMGNMDQLKQVLPRVMKAAEVDLAGGDVRSVRFCDLDKADVLEELWRHCLPHLPFDRRRAQMLCRLNVQTDPAKTPFDFSEDIYDRARGTLDNVLGVKEEAAWR